MEHRPQIGNVRGCGLMIDLELVKDRQSKQPFTAKDTANLNVEIAILGLILSNHTEQPTLAATVDHKRITGR